MKKYGVNELRQMFLDFMESKGHLVMKSFSLVPQGDKSLLLINAGMAPLKPYFTGAEKPPRTRVTTCQKCIRTGDIENVGKTARHGTFFEMLGNFSQKLSVWMQTDFIHLCIRTMMRLLISGIKKSESRQTEFSVLVKKIISGNMVQVHVAHVLKSIMTVGKNTVVANLAVP